MDTPESDLREAGTALLRQGKFAEAAQTLTDAVGQNPNDGTLWSLLGAALSSSGDANKAVEAFSRAAALTPAAAKSQFNLGVAYQATGQNNEAIAAFQKALTLDPGYEQAREKLNQLGVAPPAPSMGTTNLGGGGNTTGLSGVGSSYVPTPESGTTNLGGGDISGLSGVGTNYAPPPAGQGGTTNLGGGDTSGLSGVGGNGNGAPPLRPPYVPPAAPNAYGNQGDAPSPYAQPAQGGVPPNPYGQNAYAPQPQLGMNYAGGGQVAPDLKASQLLWTAIAGFVCFGIILGPYVIINANKALATLDQYPNDGGQRSTINTARIIAIVVTALSALGIVGRIALSMSNK